MPLSHETQRSSVQHALVLAGRMCMWMLQNLSLACAEGGLASCPRAHTVVCALQEFASGCACTMTVSSNAAPMMYIIYHP